MALATLLGMVAVAALAVVAERWIETGPWYPLRAAGLFATMMAIAATVAGAQHPLPRFGPANRVTMVRAMFVSLVAALLAEPVTPVTAWWMVCAAALMGALDGLDGWLARRTSMSSEFGARFDMETDALLILVLSALVWRYGKAGPWVMLCGAMRYAFVAAGWVLPWMAGRLRPTFRGKTVAVVQLVGLSVALAPIVAAPVSTIVAAITLLTLIWSFAIDVGRLWRGQAA
jgi:phosphatidylglycerophosphate synthase